MHALLPLGVYMGSVCAHRFVAGRDHRAVYDAAGLAAASSLFIEKIEAGGVSALSHASRDRFARVDDVGQRLLPAVPHELLLCGVSAGLMHLYENEPDTLASFLRFTIRRFVHRPSGPLPNSASER